MLPVINITSPNPLSPIVVQSPDQRLATFLANSNSIYSKFSPYDDSGPGFRLGYQQPYVWTSLTDSGDSKNLTKYDNQVFPIGSTIRDVERMTKFMASGTGLLFLGKQFLLQQQGAFNETRIYNPLSVLGATAQAGSIGIIERPVRFIASDGTIGNLVTTALTSAIGLKSKSMDNKPDGVASGKVISLEATDLGGANKGLVRFETGQKALSRFTRIWTPSSNTNSGASGGFLSNLANSLIDNLSNMIPSTSPHGKSGNAGWSIRPEYPNTSAGAYDAFLGDSSGLLSIISPADPNSPYTVKQFQRFYPIKAAGGDNKLKWYAPPSRIVDEDTISSPVTNSIRPQQTIKSYQYQSLKTAIKDFNVSPIIRHSAERLSKVQVIEYGGKIGTYGTYSDIPDGPYDSKTFTQQLKDPLTLDARGFSKAAKQGNSVIGAADTYNSLTPFYSARLSDGTAPKELLMTEGSNDSKDIVFFYFYDLVNSIYIPFRATVTGLQDLNTADWEEISYVGRADKLYMYKGFTREINFSFTVYANSILELFPMWQRINYLVGLSRPSKYTDSPPYVPPTPIVDPNAIPTVHVDLRSQAQIDADNKAILDSAPAVLKKNTSQFMYPPMATFRLGDMFVDQPCVLKSIGITIPEEASWETQRGTTLTFLQGLWQNNVYKDMTDGQFIYQLPTKVDITINMSIMEKKRSIINDDHYYVTQKNGMSAAAKKAIANAKVLGDAQNTFDTAVDTFADNSFTNTSTPFKFGGP